MYAGLGTIVTSAERPTRLFFILTFPCALLAVGASLWWSYGGESTLALVVTLVAWAATGLLGFASGLRGEHRQWNVSPLVSGLLTAVITIGATFGAIVVVNFRTSPGREALTTPVSGPKHWVALVETAAQEGGDGEVLSVQCDMTRPNTGEIAACAVTYEGPKCQYWFVGSRDGEDVAEADDEINNGGAYYDAGGAICDWPVPEIPG